VVAEASNATDALSEAVAHRPDLCVIAVGLPGNGIAAARLIKQSLPATKVVMMTAAARDEDLFGALRAGADGYLLMSTSASRLPHALLGVVHGEAALPRELTARLIHEFREPRTRRRLNLPDAGRSADLTAREFEVLQRLQNHEQTAEIAARLGISDVTVRRHISSVLGKLGMPSRRSVIEMLDQLTPQELQSTEPD
jgi:DNA-binding NarL/FixJ family response regulator